MASSRSMRVNAKAHHAIGNRIASGGSSHSGMVNSHPSTNSVVTHTAFQTLATVALRPRRCRPG